MAIKREEGGRIRIKPAGVRGGFWVMNQSDTGYLLHCETEAEAATAKATLDETLDDLARQAEDETQPKGGS